MAICVPCHLDVGMPEAARYLLNIDAGVAQQRRMTVSEFMDRPMRQAGSLCVLRVVIF